MKTIADILLEARQHAGFKLQEVAEQVGVDQGLISKYERGKRVPSQTDVGRLAEFYGLSADEMENLRVVEKVVGILQDRPAPLELLQVAESRIEYLTQQRSTTEVKLSSEVARRLKAIDKLQARWAKLRPIEGVQLEKMLEFYKVKYTFESNRIEGNTLTLQETHLVINEGLTIGGKSMREHLEAINHSDAIDYLMELIHENADFQSRILLDAHCLLLKGIDQRNAGKYRDVPVRISGSEHIPPQPYLVPNLMNDFFIHYRQQRGSLHPVIMAAELHERLVSIHPFVDGNGRTARLIMNLILLRHGFTIANLKGDQKSRLAYYQALESVQVNNDPTPFYLLIANEVERSLEEHLEMV